jgi:hypothetical protein
VYGDGSGSAGGGGYAQRRPLQPDFSTVSTVIRSSHFLPPQRNPDFNVESLFLPGEVGEPYIPPQEIWFSQFSHPNGHPLLFALTASIIGHHVLKSLIVPNKGQGSGFSVPLPTAQQEATLTLITSHEAHAFIHTVVEDANFAVDNQHEANPAALPGQRRVIKYYERCMAKLIETTRSSCHSVGGLLYRHSVDLLAHGTWGAINLTAHHTMIMGVALGRYIRGPRR